MTQDIRALLRKYDLRVKKGLGQNFLVNPDILQKIVQAGGIGPSDTVLEVGPGLGSLTIALAAVARRVVAVEIDDRLLAPLSEVLADSGNVQVIHGDILDQQIPALMAAPAPYTVVANIPYYITSAIIRHLLEGGHPPQRLVLTVQREVAVRICAKPPDMNLLALSVGVYGAAETIFRIPAGSFYPPPKVDSAVVRIIPYDSPRIPVDSIEAFFRLAKAGFSQKRKTLRNSLAGGMQWEKAHAEEVLAAAGIDFMRRAETLGFEEWGAIINVVKSIQHGEHREH